MPHVMIIIAALIGTAAITVMRLVGGWITAGLKPGSPIPTRTRIELHVSSAACLAMLGQIRLLAAAR